MCNQMNLPKAHQLKRETLGIGQTTHTSMIRVDLRNSIIMQSLTRKDMMLRLEMTKMS